MALPVTDTLVATSRSALEARLPDKHHCEPRKRPANGIINSCCGSAGQSLPASLHEGCWLGNCQSLCCIVDNNPSHPRLTDMCPSAEAETGRKRLKHELLWDNKVAIETLALLAQHFADRCRCRPVSTAPTTASAAESTAASTAASTADRRARRCSALRAQLMCHPTADANAACATAVLAQTMPAAARTSRQTKRGRQAAAAPVARPVPAAGPIPAAQQGGAAATRCCRCDCWPRRRLRRRPPTEQGPGAGMGLVSSARSA